MNTVNITFSCLKFRTVRQQHYDMARTNVSIWYIRRTVFMTDFNSSVLVHVASMVHLVACFCEKKF